MDTSEESTPFPDYINRLKKCSALKKWMQLVMEFRGPHPPDNPRMQILFKNKIVNDWFCTEQKCFKDEKMVIKQAHSLLDHKDLNFVQWSRQPNFHYYNLHGSIEHMRGPQYTCEKCGKVYFSRFTAANPNAMFDLEYDMLQEDSDSDDDYETVTEPLFDHDEEHHSSSTITVTDEKEGAATAAPLPLPVRSDLSDYDKDWHTDIMETFEMDFKEEPNLGGGKEEMNMKELLEEPKPGTSQST